jgi:hypothetical protein
MHQSYESKLISLLYSIIEEWVNIAKIQNILREKIDDLDNEIKDLSSGSWKSYLKRSPNPKLVEITKSSLLTKMTELKAQKEAKFQDLLNLQGVLDRKLQDYLHPDKLFGQAARNIIPGNSGHSYCSLIEISVNLAKSLDMQVHFSKCGVNKDWLKFLDMRLAAEIQDCYNNLRSHS